MDTATAIRTLKNALNERKALWKVLDMLDEVQQAEIAVAGLKEKEAALKDAVAKLEERLANVGKAVKLAEKEANDTKAAFENAANADVDDLNADLEEIVSLLNAKQAKLEEVEADIATKRSIGEAVVAAKKAEADKEQKRLDKIRRKIEEVKKL